MLLNKCLNNTRIFSVELGKLGIDRSDIEFDVALAPCTQFTHASHIRLNGPQALQRLRKRDTVAGVRTADSTANLAFHTGAMPSGASSLRC